MIRKGAVLAGALAALLLPVGGQAWAAPEPPPATEPGDGRADGRRDGRGNADSAADAARTARLEKVRRRIAELHDQAGSATDAYNAAQQKVRRQERRIADLARRIDNNRVRLDKLNDQAGAMARAQYRGLGLPVNQRLAVERDPERFLHSLGLLRQGQRATRGVINDLAETQETLRSYAKKAGRQWEQLEADRKARAKAKKKIEEKLKAAEKLESELASDDRARLAELEDQASYRRQLDWLRSGVLEEINGTASAKGRAALAFALDQIGRDYEWGATGPRTFDCSGLTLRAWEAAGVRIPRTSQQQWQGLKRVPIKDMRPGDLIIYKTDASHVGMYVGDGTMVHSPRTGRQVRVEGVGALPIRGVVRPDA
ncbi:C40 family peptidase [Streptomyces durbertensis]|uniref:C40 family peptidase n=1 Tax=Streptomyces durbertensis TaxID=2448886 RepID=A0ABR6EGA8_9ACTN|nr:NlpC/P60 family protein [Streptomyces durbertensis]MBB1244369.1 C40 family peptidase [Streptomyces durbertensis]